MNVSVESDRVLKGNEFRFVRRCSPSGTHSGFLIARGSTRRARPIRSSMSMHQAADTGFLARRGLDVI